MQSPSENESKGSLWVYPFMKGENGVRNWQVIDRLKTQGKDLGSNIFGATVLLASALKTHYERSSPMDCRPAYRWEAVGVW